MKNMNRATILNNLKIWFRDHWVLHFLFLALFFYYCSLALGQQPQSKRIRPDKKPIKESVIEKDRTRENPMLYGDEQIEKDSTRAPKPFDAKKVKKDRSREQPMLFINRKVEIESLKKQIQRLQLEQVKAQSFIEFLEMIDEDSIKVKR